MKYLDRPLRLYEAGCAGCKVVIGCLSFVVLALGCGCQDMSHDKIAQPVEVEVEDEDEDEVTNWPYWRGQLQDGKSQDSLAPITWSEEKNIVWKQTIVGWGQSSPTVWGKHVFITTSNINPQEQIALCYDRTSGKQIWSTVVHEGGLVDKTNDACSFATSTPACDGKQVYFTFLNGSAIWITAMDLTGKIVWQQKVGSYKSIDGFAASPVLYKSLVIVGGDNVGSDSFLAAVDCASGRIVWKVQRPAANNVAAPIVAHIASRDQLLLSGGGTISAYAPDSGKLLWSCRGFAEEAASTMTYEGQVVYANGGDPDQGTFCVSADGSSDVTGSHLIWRKNHGKTYASSLLVHEGTGYSVTRGGILVCFDAFAGQKLWHTRLSGGFFSSPILAGNNFYLQDMTGSTYVIRASSESYELLAQNQLPEGGFASPVICGGQIFLRTLKHLYCIGHPTDEKAPMPDG